MTSITLVRHGRSEANDAKLWQGQHDSPLSAEGRIEAKKLASRIDPERYDRVISSDLSRAVETAEATGARPSFDPEWREMHLGDWEGKSFEEISAEHPELLAAFRRGDPVRFGGDGETVPEFEERARRAFDALVGSLEGGQRALVVCHGGVIDALVARALGRSKDRRTFPIVANTSLTMFSDAAQARSNTSMRLQVFNDATHLGWDAGTHKIMRHGGTPMLGLVRHAVTGANKTKRIQGRSCWGLDDEGRSQASAFSEWYGPVGRVLSSPTQRASETAAIISGDVPIEVDDMLVEMSFGEWEGRNYDDVFRSSDGLAGAIFAEGQDLPRGGTGETFAQVGDRMGSFLERVVIEPEVRTLAVSHGAAIKTLIARIFQRGYDIVDGLATPSNASVSHIALTKDGPMLADFSLTPEAA